MQEISAASIEQNSGADQINNAIQQLNQVTQHNASASEELATSAEELSSQADHLRELIAFFKISDALSENNFDANKLKQKLLGKAPSQKQSPKAHTVRDTHNLGRGYNYHLHNTNSGNEDLYENF